MKNIILALIWGLIVISTWSYLLFFQYEIAKSIAVVCFGCVLGKWTSGFYSWLKSKEEKKKSEQKAFEKNEAFENRLSELKKEASNVRYEIDVLRDKLRDDQTLTYEEHKKLNSLYLRRSSLNSKYVDTIYRFKYNEE